MPCFLFVSCSSSGGSPPAPPSGGSGGKQQKQEQPGEDRRNDCLFLALSLSLLCSRPCRTRVVAAAAAAAAVVRCGRVNGAKRAEGAENEGPLCLVLFSFSSPPFPHLRPPTLLSLCLSPAVSFSARYDALIAGCLPSPSNMHKPRMPRLPLSFLVLRQREARLALLHSAVDGRPSAPRRVSRRFPSCRLLLQAGAGRGGGDGDPPQMMCPKCMDSRAMQLRTISRLPCCCHCRPCCCPCCFCAALVSQASGPALATCAPLTNDLCSSQTAACSTSATAATTFTCCMTTRARRPRSRARTSPVGAERMPPPRMLTPACPPAPQRCSAPLYPSEKEGHADAAHVDARHAQAAPGGLRCLPAAAPLCSAFGFNAWSLASSISNPCVFFPPPLRLSTCCRSLSLGKTTPSARWLWQSTTTTSASLPI